MAKAHKPEAPQDFTGRLADKAVKTKKLKQHQMQKPSVLCDDTHIENVFNFTYLWGHSSQQMETRQGTSKKEWLWPQSDAAS